LKSLVQSSILTFEILATGDWPLATDYWRLTTGDWPLAADYFFDSCQRSAISRQFEIIGSKFNFNF
jgi:hypothetical protein